MLLSASLAVSPLSAAPADPPPPACEPAFSARFPALAPLFTEAGRLRRAAREGGASLSGLVKQGATLEKRAGRELERIQSAGCELEEEDVRRFDACVSPVRWGRESVPSSLDWRLLKDVPRSGDEALAYALSLPEGGGGVDLLSETASFAGGCGDFGCAPGSLALPSLLGEPEQVEQLVTLAARPGLFGQRALERLETLGSTLAKASCEGGGPAAEKRNRRPVLAPAAWVSGDGGAYGVPQVPSGRHVRLKSQSSSLAQRVPEEQS
jgi:hypothetical protein